jgi:hypothetical protein
MTLDPSAGFNIFIWTKMPPLHLKDSPTAFLGLTCHPLPLSLPSSSILLSFFHQLCQCVCRRGRAPTLGARSCAAAGAIPNRDDHGRRGTG